MIKPSHFLCEIRICIVYLCFLTLQRSLKSSACSVTDDEIDLSKIINYLRNKLSRVQFIMLVATLVGLASGLAAVLLKTVVHYIQHWIEHIPVTKFAYLLFPVTGIVITVFIIHRYFHGQIERGIAMVLRAIARKSSLFR